MPGAAFIVGVESAVSLLRVQIKKHRSTELSNGRKANHSCCRVAGAVDLTDRNCQNLNNKHQAVLGFGDQL